MEVPGLAAGAGGGTAHALGGILVFLTGVGEVTRLVSRLSEHPLLRSKPDKFRLFALHSALPSTVQAQVFKRVR